MEVGGEGIVQKLIDIYGDGISSFALAITPNSLGFQQQFQPSSPFDVYNKPKTNPWDGNLLIFLRNYYIKKINNNL